jgi:glycosyltransferase involved in cell wall biosynthesis
MKAERKLRIASLFPVYSTGQAISHIALSLCHHMRSEVMEVRLVQPASDPAGRREFTSDAIPSFLQAVAYRLLRSEKSINRLLEFVFLRSLSPGEVTYVWPGVSLAAYRRIKERGHCLVVERINCHAATAKRILDDAYARRGMTPGHAVTDEWVQEEHEGLALSDYVFAPSTLVADSFLQNGVPPEKILLGTYGWDPDRLGGTRAALPSVDGTTVLFTGLACVRKGIHLLLEAWARARIKGRLVLAGGMDEEVAVLCADHLNRADVLHLGHVRDIGAVYRSADIFAFATLEEGSPLVTYEAMASGLPVVLSPMGAGTIARPEQDGFVLDPYDQEAWVTALRRLAHDADLRRSMGESARCRAEDFTWDKVGHRRRELLLDRLAQGGRG